MSPVVRSAAAADVPALVAFNCALASETEAKELDPAVVTAGVNAGLADAHKARYFVAEVDGVVAGMLMLTTEWSDWRNGWIWWIQSVYVRAEFRRRGVFRALYDHVYQQAIGDDTVIGLRLYMERDNHRAEQTYKALGMDATPYVVLQRFPL